MFVPVIVYSLLLINRGIIMGANNADVKGSNNPNFKGGYQMKYKKTSLYNSWQGMKARCLRKTHPKFPRYGGRGITVCEEWMAIKGFVEWAIPNGWKHGLSIDRIDNDGNYEPSNCRWVTVAENSRSKKTTKLSIEDALDIRIKYNNGVSMPDLAAEYGVVHGTIWFIVKNFTHVPDGECTKAIKAAREAKLN